MKTVLFIDHYDPNPTELQRQTQKRTTLRALDYKFKREFDCEIVHPLKRLEFNPGKHKNEKNACYYTTLNFIKRHRGEGGSKTIIIDNFIADIELLWVLIQNLRAHGNPITHFVIFQPSDAIKRVFPNAFFFSPQNGDTPQKLFRYIEEGLPNPDSFGVTQSERNTKHLPVLLPSTQSFQLISKVLGNEQYTRKETHLLFSSVIPKREPSKHLLVSLKTKRVYSVGLLQGLVGHLRAVLHLVEGEGTQEELSFRVVDISAIHDSSRRLVTVGQKKGTNLVMGNSDIKLEFHSKKEGQ